MTTAERIWNAVLDPDKGDLAPVVAKHFLLFAFTDDERKRHSHLANTEYAKLNESERSELATLEQISVFVSQIQHKARLSLGEQKP